MHIWSVVCARCMVFVCLVVMEEADEALVGLMLNFTVLLAFDFIIVGEVAVVSISKCRHHTERR